MYSGMQHTSFCAVGFVSSERLLHVAVPSNISL